MRQLPNAWPCGQIAQMRSSRTTWDVSPRYARFHHSPPAASRRGDAHGGADRVHAVPLRRRSGQHDGRHRDHRGGAGAITSGSRPQRPNPHPIRTLHRQCGAAEFRQLLPVQDAGDRSDRRSLSRHHGAGVRVGDLLPADRHSDGRIHGAAPAIVALQHFPGGIAHRHFAADVPHRHPVDLLVPGHARRAAVVWTR